MPPPSPIATSIADESPALVPRPWRADQFMSSMNSLHWRIPAGAAISEAEARDGGGQRQGRRRANKLRSH
eukprot:14336792-Alexandrium_andersonii.AAC.1